MMQKQKAAWALVPIFAGPIGIFTARYHLITASPALFFTLGVLATCCVGGIVYGIYEATRGSRGGLSIRD